MRGIFLERTGVALLWHQVVPMTLLAVIMLVLSVLHFRKKLE